MSEVSSWHGSLNKGGVRSDVNKAPSEASGARASANLQIIISGITIMSKIYEYIDMSMIDEYYSVRRIILSILSVLHLFFLFTTSLGAIAYIICQVWTSCPSSRVVNLALHISAVVTMVECFLTVALLNERHSLSGSSSISLCIILIVTVFFVLVMGYEAWKRPDVNYVPEQISDNLITTQNQTFTEAYAIKGYAEELWGPMILSVVLTPFIEILIFGNFENHQLTASDRHKGQNRNSLYIAAISSCFLTYIIGVISMLLNLHAPKVKSESHQEKVENALGVLNFIYIFLVIVTVVIVTACHIGEYALLNAIPLLAGLAWPHAKSVLNLMSNIYESNFLIYAIMVVVGALLAEETQEFIPQGSNFYFYRGMIILFVSMELVLYLSRKLATLIHNQAFKVWSKKMSISTNSHPL